MARSKVGLSGGLMIESVPKKTRQGSGQHTQSMLPRLGMVRRSVIADRANDPSAETPRFIVYLTR